MIVYNAKFKGKIYRVIDSRESEHLLEKGDEFYVWEKEEDIDELEIECSECDAEKWVEAGTWALDKGMCHTCYCAYRGG